MADAGGVGKDDSVDTPDVDEVGLRLKLKLSVADADVPVGSALVVNVLPVPEVAEVVVAVTTLVEKGPVEAETVDVGAVAAVEDGGPVGLCGHHGQL